MVGRHCFLSWQVGGKTPFILVKRARVLRVTRRQAAKGGRGGERLGLVHVSGKKKKKREARRALGAALPTVGEGCRPTHSALPTPCASHGASLHC